MAALSQQEEAGRLIQGMLKRLDGPAHWTKGTEARDRHGEDVQSTDETAVRWCLMGALEAEAARLGLYKGVYSGVRGDAKQVILDAINARYHDRVAGPDGFKSLPHFNDDDGTGAREVRTVLRDALRSVMPAKKKKAPAKKRDRKLATHTKTVLARATELVNAPVVAKEEVGATV